MKQIALLVKILITYLVSYFPWSYISEKNIISQLVRFFFSVLGIKSRFFCFVFWWDWDLDSGLQVYKQSLYCLSHTSSPFALVILEMGISQSICLRLALNHDSPNLSLSNS
jgi:hypothetical protein